MKVFILLVVLGLAAADSDGSRGIRPIVNYADDGSSVTILRGADLDRGRSYESRPKVRYEAPRVRYVEAPRVRYEQPASVEYVRPAPRVRYVEPTPVVRYVQAPAPKVRYVQPAPQVRYVQSAPKVRYVSRPKVQYVAPRVETVQYEQPQINYAPAPAPVKYQVSRPRYEEDSYSNDDARYSFAYEVRDDETYNYQARQETRDGNKLSGSYVVQDPDGYLRTVKYADEGYGFVATVTRTPIGSSGYKSVSGVSSVDSSED